MEPRAKLTSVQTLLSVADSWFRSEIAWTSHWKCELCLKTEELHFHLLFCLSSRPSRTLNEFVLADHQATNPECLRIYIEVQSVLRLTLMYKMSWCVWPKKSYRTCINTSQESFRLIISRNGALDKKRRVFEQWISKTCGEERNRTIPCIAAAKQRPVAEFIHPDFIPQSWISEFGY